jgi:hypothetical protein
MRTAELHWYEAHGLETRKIYLSVSDPDAAKHDQGALMRIRRLGIAAAIISTLGFSCYNEPHYPRLGMSNGPVGSGSGTASVTYGGPSAGSAPVTSSVAASRSDSSRGAANKRP